MNPFNAALAIEVLCAGDVDEIFTQAGVEAGGNPVLPPASDPLISYINGTNFEAMGQLRADDLFITKGRNVYYGLLLRCTRALGRMMAGDYLVAVRGTMDPLEWANDACAEVLEAVSGIQGMVGSGFWDVYASLKLANMDGAVMPGSAAQAIAKIVGPGNLFVTGHSLGAALATYLAMDLQPAFSGRLGSLACSFFASPKPGSEDFADGYLTRVQNFTAVTFAADLVPMLPSSPPSMALKGGGPDHNVILLPRDSKGAPLRLDPVSCHAVETYAGMLLGM